MALLQGVIVAARNIRGELGIKPKDPITPTVRTGDAEAQRVLESFRDAIRQLTMAADVKFEHVSGARPKGVGYAVVQGVEVLVPLAGLIDPNAEAARLERQIASAGKDVEKLQKQLSNEAFVARAPKETVDAARGELEAAQAKVRKLEEALGIVRETT
jgi:valyl-tRNA synthetase